MILSTDSQVIYTHSYSLLQRKDTDPHHPKDEMHRTFWEGSEHEAAVVLRTLYPLSTDAQQYARSSTNQENVSEHHCSVFIVTSLHRHDWLTAHMAELSL